MKKIVGWALAALLALVIVATAGIGWYYAGEIHSSALLVDRTPWPRDLTATAVGDGTITLATTAESDIDYGDWRAPGVWGLDWDGGYGQVGEIVEPGDGEVVRRFTPTRGTPPVGTLAKLDDFAFEGDPLTALALPFETVTYDGELGPLTAWLVPGTARTWAIFTHGKGQNRTEMLRFLPPFVDAGMPSLVIEYRNDADVFVSASGVYDYGLSEWRDLEAAVQFALDRGAEGIVLFGDSMGGGITMSFMERSALADRVRAVVLDAPMLSLSDVVDFGAERMNLPYALTWIGKKTAALRYGISWQDTDYLRDVSGLNAPILLIHGDGDRLVHFRTSEALAAARPDLVTFVPVAGAGHVNAWNRDPAAYDSAVSAFLAAQGIS